jgi:hypothetical protein
MAGLENRQGTPQLYSVIHNFWSYPQSGSPQANANGLRRSVGTTGEKRASIAGRA